jgi:hypothetical protein
MRNRAAWNPLGGAPFDPMRIRDLGTQLPAPATGIDWSQGQVYPDDIAQDLAIPQDLGINIEGFVNPYSFTIYTFPVPNGATPDFLSSVRVVPANVRRTYLLIQNQGPGNIWLNFGQDVTIATVTANSNGMLLIQTQFYEQVGGGYLNNRGESIPHNFVSPDYISAIADQAGTTIMVGEGVWRANSASGFRTADDSING